MDLVQAALWMVADHAVSVAILADVWSTILHPDAEGRIVGILRRTVWRVASRAAGRRRAPLVLAGPLLVASTFLTWTVLAGSRGVALAAVRPHLDDFRTAGGVTADGLADAVYYAGAPLTVLGYGDITPATGPSKILRMLISAIGFALVTYLHPSRQRTGAT